MFVLHCTKKAQERLKVKPFNTLPEPTTSLGNWYCNEFIAFRHKYLIFVNERTLLPIVIAVKGLRSSDDILEVFKQRLFKIFFMLELPEEKFMPELLAMDKVVFAKTSNRSIIGSMNDFVVSAKSSSQIRGIAVDGLAMFELLSKIPMKANNYEYSTKLVARLFQ